MTFSISDFDKFPTENQDKQPNCVIIHPDKYRASSDQKRVYVETFLGFFCYRDGVCVGEAMNKEDAVAWVDTNKEIEMWT